MTYDMDNFIILKSKSQKKEKDCSGTDIASKTLSSIQP